MFGMFAVEGEGWPFEEPHSSANLSFGYVANVSLNSGVPPPLPPSVEESYRRKCIQLKQRANDLDEANDISRLRLTRQSRGIKKLRLERAFLLEQLAKRTSTNVEDSEGSPSPPPTVSSHI
jgi:non-histone protein 10